MQSPEPARGKGGGAGGSRRPNKRRRRPPRQRDEQQSPVEVLKNARKPAISEKPADEPLSPAEAAEMREHFRFLRDHRKLLHLRLNAQEDLLLNGVRPPTHRGVCQHLLSKIDRARITSAIERLTPVEALNLAQGMVRISPDIGYVLLYLECVKASASAADATAALLRVLKQLRFSEVSPAQMRRVLDLIVELFDARELPQLLLSLLENGAFRAAFDQSTKDMPAALADIVLPLRAAQAVVVADRRNPCSPEDLRRGVHLLLQARESTQRAVSEDVRQRLVRLALELVEAPEAEWISWLRPWIRGFEAKSRASSEAALGLASACLRLGKDNEARKILEELRREVPDLVEPQRWLAALGGRRFGAIAALDRLQPERPRADGAGQRAPERPVPTGPTRARFHNGFWLSFQAPVWLCVGTSAEAERFRDAEDRYQRALIPGVARLAEAGRAGDGSPYLALSKHGRSAHDVVAARQGMKAREALGLASGGTRLLHALALVGIALPDVDAGRFTLNDAYEVGVRDLFDTELTTVEDARVKNFALAKDWSRRVLGAARVHTLPPASMTGIEASADFGALARALEGRPF